MTNKNRVLGLSALAVLITAFVTFKLLRSPKGGAVAPNVTQEMMEKLNKPMERAELQRFQELTKRQAIELRDDMKKSEIESLKKSIIEDQKTLKKIEASGGGIDAYKMVERNLDTRKRRLKELSAP
jgi:hypothetical protein